MTTINTIEDLIRLLDENPEWLEALRARLLTRELLEMPQTLARFMETTNRRFDALEHRMDGVESDIQTLKTDVQTLKADNVSIRSDIQSIRNDLGYLKAGHARNAAVTDAYNLARDMGLRYVSIMERAELGSLLDANDTSDLAIGDLRSFRRADLIIRALDREDRNCYIAAEISFTVNGRDTSRAIRNAGLINRFTDSPAFPVVAGVHLDERVRHLADSGEIFFYQLEPDLLEVE